MTLNSDVTAPVTEALRPGADEDPDDSGYGWAMFLAFASAVLAITFTVCVLAMVGSWWMLGVAFAADLGITALVMKVTLGAFASPAYPDLEGVELASKSARPTQTRELEARRAALVAHQ